MEGKFYVYFLNDPRGRRPFYIGKGCGNRLRSHEAAVRSGREKNPVKALMIKDIWAAGLEVEKGILGRFEDEAKAYAFERRMIRLFAPKANISHGFSKRVTFFGMISEMCRAGRDLREDFKRRFPREIVASVYPAEMVKLYDTILRSPRFKTSEAVSGTT